MKNTARLYNCIRCHSQVMICSHCDRGNRYCTVCAPIACLEAKRRASARYQNSLKGRMAHAARQKCYLTRVKNKVTHKGSNAIYFSVLIFLVKKNAGNTPSINRISNGKNIYCRYCDKLCSPFLRLNHLHSSA